MPHWPAGAIDLVGYIAAVLTTMSWVPQLRRTWRTRSTADISSGMLAAFTTGVALWLLYGVAVDSSPMIAANGVTLALSLALVAMKIAFDRRPPPT